MFRKHQRNVQSFVHCSRWSQTNCPPNFSQIFYPNNPCPGGLCQPTIFSSTAYAAQQSQLNGLCHQQSISSKIVPQFLTLVSTNPKKPSTQWPTPHQSPVSWVHKHVEPTIVERSKMPHFCQPHMLSSWTIPSHGPIKLPARPRTLQVLGRLVFLQRW